MNKPNDHIDPLLEQCLDGTASDAQYREAWEWVKSSQANRGYYYRMRDAWIAAGMLQPVAGRDIDANWSRLEKRINPSPVRRLKPRPVIPQWMKIAAMMTIVFGLGMMVHALIGGRQAGVQPQGAYTIVAPKGSKSQAVLADGTKVWLNAGSKLTFDAGFDRQARELSLTGEAYFEVAHNPGKPFLVHAAGVTVRALGTSFNVKAYPDENIIETTLVEGSVRIENDRQESRRFEPVVMTPKQTVRFYKKEPEPSQQQVVQEATPQTAEPVQDIERVDVSETANTAKYTSWKDKRWIFEGEDMGSLARKLERLYDVQINFEDESLKTYKLTGTLEEESIEQLLGAIRIAIPMDYRIEKNKVYLKVNQKLKADYEELY